MEHGTALAPRACFWRLSGRGVVSETSAKAQLQSPLLMPHLLPGWMCCDPSSPRFSANISFRCRALKKLESHTQIERQHGFVIALNQYGFPQLLQALPTAILGHAQASVLYPSCFPNSTHSPLLTAPAPSGTQIQTRGSGLLVLRCFQCTSG